jgi:hypothetical protein
MKETCSLGQSALTIINGSKLAEKDSTTMRCIIYVMSSGEKADKQFSGIKAFDFLVH